MAQEPSTPPSLGAPSHQIRVSWRHRMEYVGAAGLLKLLGTLPHSTARVVCSVLAGLSYALWPRLQGIGMANLRIAYPNWSERARRLVLRACFQSLGRMLADFAHFPKLNSLNIHRLIVYDGLEHFSCAASQGKGLIFLTAHFGNWELGSFAHGLYGHPVSFIVRRLDNPLIDRLVNRYRCLSGGKPIEKSEFARQVLRAIRQREAVGILMDQNMLTSEGVFVEFFGLPASTTVGPAWMAQKTGAPLVLGLVIWDSKLKKYRLRFDSIEWESNADPQEEIRVNTAKFTRLLEQYIRKYPDQWLWVHRRWKTRPSGSPPLYP